jgi:pimeloyl-ACP methyl ester carboxylesterase
MPYASVNGTKLHYHVTGDGLPIVCIHPPLLNQQIFNYQKAQLSDRYQVLTFDIRGHGHTPYSPQPVTYTLVVEDICQLLDYLHIKEAVLCGYSTGGSIALEALLTHRERFVGAVLLSAMPEASDWFLKSRIRMATGLSRLKAKRLLGGTIGWGNADMSQTFGNLYKGAVEGNIRNIEQYYSYSLDYSCTERLPEIKQPVLLLYGKEDTSFHRYAHMLNDRLPNRDLVFLEGIGHQIPTKAPRAMHRLMDQWFERRLGIKHHPDQEAEGQAPITEISSFAPLPAEGLEGRQEL